MPRLEQRHTDLATFALAFACQIRSALRAGTRLLRCSDPAYRSFNFRAADHYSVRIEPNAHTRRTERKGEFLADAADNSKCIGG